MNLLWVWCLDLTIKRNLVDFLSILIFVGKDESHCKCLNFFEHQLLKPVTLIGLYCFDLKHLSFGR